MTDAHTDSGTGVLQTYQLLSLPVQREDGEWSVGRVLKRDKLSINIVYQKMLREGRRNGLPVSCRRMMDEQDEEIQHLREQVSLE